MDHAHVKPGTTMDCFGALCHSASSMQYISNQDVGGDADAWLAWWAENRSKSQEAWITDGFRTRGFEIDVPPTAGQIPVLLEVLGNTETNELTAIPVEMKHNAFRCLRDSGFEPVAYALSNRSDSAEVERGLKEYARRERQWPSSSGVGVLPFGTKIDDWNGMQLPTMLTTRFQITAHALVFGPVLIGLAMLICSFRRKMYT